MGPVSLQELDRSIVDLDDILAVVPENEETAPLIEQADRLRKEAHKVVQVSEGATYTCAYVCSREKSAFILI